jgi:hypothetical protein
MLIPTINSSLTQGEYVSAREMPLLVIEIDYLHYSKGLVLVMFGSHFLMAGVNLNSSSLG